MKTRSYIIYIYLITPIVALVIFATYFKSFQARQKAIEDQQAIIDRQKADEKATEQKELEKKLDVEAKRIAAAKAAAMAEKEAKETAERREKIEEVRKHIEATNADLQRLNKNNADQEAKVKAAREKRIKTESDWLSQAKAMEEERALKAATDLEAQRLIGMVIDRFEGEWAKVLTTPPPPPVK
jgi:hypothetical protein